MIAKLISKRPETEDIFSFIFEPERPIERAAGQFIRYVLPHPDTDNRGDDRWFTVSNAPFEGTIQITTRFAPRSSSFKRALNSLRIGEALKIDEPQGEFVITDLTKNYIFVAGGIGITPFHSILAEADHNNQKLKARVLYGNRDKEILFKKDLDGFVQRNPGLTIEYIVDQGGITAAQLEHAVRQTDNPYIYLSGPEPMVESLVVLVKRLGVDIGHIQTDFFTGYS